MNFRDIEQFTQLGSWQCNFSLIRLIPFIDEQVAESGLQLMPDFQRGHVWSDEQSANFIEFILRGGKSAHVIYLNCPTWHVSNELVGGYNDFVCVDGLQRITAIRKFLNNEIKAFGCYFKEFTGHLRGHCDMLVNVNDLKTRREVLQWYLEMNSGGVVHTDSELDKVRCLLADEAAKDSEA